LAKTQTRQEHALGDAVTLVLTRDFIAARVTSSAYVAAVRRAFEQLAHAQIHVPPVGHARGFDGAFHVKSATGLEPLV